MISKNLQSVKDKTSAISKSAYWTLVTMMMTNVAFADYKSEIQKVLKNMIGVVGTVFSAVGIILAVYAVGQLVMAFKNEDANSKSSASTLLVVGIVLIFIPTIIDSLDLVGMLN